MSGRGRQFDSATTIAAMGATAIAVPASMPTARTREPDTSADDGALDRLLRKAFGRSASLGVRGVLCFALLDHP